MVQRKKNKTHKDREIRSQTERQEIEILRERE